MPNFIGCALRTGILPQQNGPGPCVHAIILFLQSASLLPSFATINHFKLMQTWQIFPQIHSTHVKDFRHYWHMYGLPPHYLSIMSIRTIIIIHHYRMHTSYTFPGQSEFKVLLTEKPVGAIGPSWTCTAQGLTSSQNNVNININKSSRYSTTWPLRLIWNMN